MKADGLYAGYIADAWNEAPWWYMIKQILPAFSPDTFFSLHSCLL